jgi:hypothetical protein
VLRARGASGVDDPDAVLRALDRLVAVGATGDHERARVALRETLARLDPTPVVASA